MTRINDVANIVRSYFKESEHYPNLWEDIAGSLDIAGHLLPDLPEPDNTYPEWQVENLSISTGVAPGEVAIEWEDREDTGRGIVTRIRYLSPAQVQAIIAAHYNREDQE